MTDINVVESNENPFKEYSPNCAVCGTENGLEDGFHYRPLRNTEYESISICMRCFYELMVSLIMEHKFYRKHTQAEAKYGGESALD